MSIIELGYGKSSIPFDFDEAQFEILGQNAIANAAVGCRNWEETRKPNRL